MSCPHSDELSILKPYIEIIDKELLNFLSRFKNPEEYYNTLLYHFGYRSFSQKNSGNGAHCFFAKRLRPLMCLLISESLTEDYHQVIPLILGIELMHNASLIHDDIQDRDEVRWGRPTVWKLFGIEQGINCGDTLQAMAYGLILELYDKGIKENVVRKVLEVSSQIHRTVVEGQYLDLMFENRTDITEAEYFDMIERKTAAPYAGAAECAALLAYENRYPERVEAYRQFGLQLGILFQLSDDILGIWGGIEKTGKTPADIRNKKKTLPVIYTFNHASPDSREKLIQLYDSPQLSDNDIFQVLNILQETGAYHACDVWIKKYYQETLSALKKTEISASFLEKLSGIADYCLNRIKVMTAAKKSV
jgi:geranylgeranyl diphosphate synthase type I